MARKSPRSRADWHLSNLVLEGSKSKYVGRDAETGQFITVKDSKRRPGTTSPETATSKLGK